MGEEHELKGLNSMGKKTPFYRRGENPTVIPSLSPHNAVLPHHERYCRSSGRSRENEQQNMNLGAVVPHISGTTAHPSGTTAPTATTTAVEPDPRKPRLEARRYQRGTEAVLPLMAMGGTTAVGQRYYRLWR